uniref:Uncharacterized protein n=1 Tax=Populus trichocarpa TaxID=3694 RepID=A0A2K1ZGU0_POPTR
MGSRSFISRGIAALRSEQRSQLSLCSPCLFFTLLHSFILLAQAITLSTCIVAHNNALLVSNNFAEIKSNVFKRLSKDNICSLVCSGLVVSCKYCRAIANHQIP